MSYQDDVNTAKRLLADLPTKWDGKTSVLEMKEADFNWRQMEWGGILDCYATGDLRLLFDLCVNAS